MCMHYISYWGGHNHITFLGDSRIRQLYFEFVNLLKQQPMKSAKMHENIDFNDEHINARVVSFKDMFGGIKSQRYVWKHKVLKICLGA